jgi:tripartite-type tricarboxylate transporter receptor subunit TctC
MKRLIATLIAVFVLSGMAAAQTFPQRLVRIVVPFPPGGSYDILARNIAQGLSETWGQQVVVENRAGGNGEVGTAAVAASPPDGYTMLFWGDGILIAQGLVKNRAVDAIKSFAPVTLVARTSQALVARADFRAKDLPALLALAKDGSVDVRYATAGVGTPGHLAVELLNAKSGGKLRHVPYRGGALALTDLLSGQIDLVSTGLPALIEHIRAGSIIPLAVSPEKRSKVLATTPTMNEVVPAVFIDTWYGFLAPAGTPDAVIAKIHTDIAAVTRGPAFVKRIEEQGFELVDVGPGELRALMERDLPRWLEIIALAGVKSE